MDASQQTAMDMQQSQPSLGALVLAWQVHGPLRRVVIRANLKATGLSRAGEALRRIETWAGWPAR